MHRRTERARRRGFSLVEVLAVLVVVSLAAAIVLPRLPGGDALALHAAAARLAERLSTARERAIVEGRFVSLDARNGLPAGIELETLDAGGTAVAADALVLAPDGDPLPTTARLRD